MLRAHTTLLARRLANQQLTEPRFDTPHEIVGWLGAVQAQEYVPAKWAIGLRSRTLTDDDVERAVTLGDIIRTHILRPTWHFVARDDIRWMLDLTGPRVSARMAPYNRKLELDGKLFAKSHDVIARALAGGQHLTRTELRRVLERVRINCSTQRLAHLMMQAELDRVICSGPRRGKDSTYALFDERVPRGQTLGRDEALTALARRYIASHGPATVQDFAWWSGLPVPDARRGFEATTPALTREVVDGVPYWSCDDVAPPRRLKASAHLLPIYDEYLNPYRNRGIVIDPRTRSVKPARRDDFGHYLIVDGRFAGTWRWQVGVDDIRVRATPYRRLTTAESRPLANVIRRMREFAGRQVTFVSA